MISKSWLLFAVLVLGVNIAAAVEPIAVSVVRVEGSQRIDGDALLTSIKAHPGVLDEEMVSADIKRLYQLGFFRRVEARLSRDSSGKSILTYVVSEKPLLRSVRFEGNEKLEAKELEGVLRFGDKRFVDDNLARQSVKAIEALYQRKGYYDAKATFRFTATSADETEVIFEVVEGPRYKIRAVRLNGLSEIDRDDLLGEIETSSYKWWSSWLFGSGRVDPQLLAADRAKLQQYLLDHGYIEGNVSEAHVERVDDGLAVVFDVVEGSRYRVGSIAVDGDLIENSVDKTLRDTTLSSGKIFSATQLREDSFTISEKFADIGHAFANVVPETSVNRGERTVNVTYEVNKGQLVSINRINITGNQKTYDNVIRRELEIQEQETYSGQKIRRSRELLERLGYFEEVAIGSEPVPGKDQVDLNVNVREGATGSFSAGAGYSSADGALINLRLNENNFLGTGRRVNFNVDFGSERRDFVISLYDRRFQDSHWALGTDIMSTMREFTDFDREMTGAGLTFGYPLKRFFEGEWAEDIDFSLRYDYYDIEISNVDLEDAADLVIASEGTTTASGITPRLIRSTINNPLNPERGSRQVLSFETTGLGGSEEYFIASFHNQYYSPLFNPGWGDVVFSWRFKFDYGETLDGDPFPLFRRFFPGGINSVRGYENRTLGPVDERGNEYGGSKQYVNNLEFIVPLLTDAGLKGVVFYDFGEAFDDEDSINFDDMRHAYGFGMRWNSPIGPLRIEFGIPINREDGEDSFVTQFSFGAPL